MSLDWGLYTAMRGQDNWQQRRADKAMNLQLLEKQTQIEQQKTAAEAQAEQSLNQYFNELQNMEFLAEDQERVNAMERNARRNVIKGIASVNGDLTRYMTSGGLTDLNTYRNNVLQSEEVKKAIKNKGSMAAFLEAKSKGMFVHNVVVPVQEKDENGKMVMKMKPMTFEENLKRFKAGQVDSLGWQGAEKKIGLNAFDFSKQPKDPRNPFSKDNLVKTSDIIFEAMQRGASREYAEHLAKEYATTTQASGRPWYWGNKSEYERQLYLAKTGKSQGSGSGGVQTLNQLYPKLSGMTEPNQSQPVTNEFNEYLSDYMKIVYDNKTNSAKTLLNRPVYDPLNKAYYDLGQAINVTLGNNVRTYIDPQNKKLRHAIEADVIYSADNTGSNLPAKEGAFYKNIYLPGWEYENAEDFGLMGDEYEGMDVMKGTMFIPIDDILANEYSRDEYNKRINITNKVHGAAPTMTTEQQEAYMNNLVNDYIAYHGGNMTWDQAYQAILEEQQNNLLNR